MTVTNTGARITLLADGATTVWTFPFPGVDPSFIQVLITTPDGVVTQLPSAAYTVTLNAPIDPNPTGIGGMVNYPLTGPPLAAGNFLTISRVLPPVQNVSLSNQSIIYPPVVEQEFDYLTMLRQEGADDFTRAFRVGPEDPSPAVVPPVAVRANLIAVFDAMGNLTASSGLLPTTFVSAAMAPVVGAATLPLARTLMGVASLDSPIFTGNPTAPTPPVADNSLSIATTQFVQESVVSAGFFTTGDLKPTHKTVADAGWIFWVDGTIGDGSSGGSIRANTDTQALFTLYYNGYTDANCPVKTSTGAATTRAAQGTAATAFSHHCRMSLPAGAGRALGIAGTGTGLTNRVIGSKVGTESVTPTIGTMAAHSHPFTGGQDGLSNVALGSGGGNNNFQFEGTDSVQGLNMTNVGGGNPANTMQPTTFINVMVKL